jgi:phosphatidylinositol alpha-1,6-mannosyltransferase
MNYLHFSHLLINKDNDNLVQDEDKAVKTILCVAALKTRKGIDNLLKAFAMILREKPATRLVIVGSGNKDRYARIATALGVVEHINFLGNIEDHKLAWLYKTCDIFVLLPREDDYGHFEGFALVYLEANAYGKPVVGTWSGGVPDAVRNAVTGLLVPPDDPNGAAQAILKLLCDENLRRAMGEAGRRWAQEHDWCCVIEDYLRVYAAVLREHAQ